jgi:hypothetical protein
LPGQVEVRNRFRQAAVYGRMALADSTSRKFYEDAASKKGKPGGSAVKEAEKTPRTGRDIMTAAEHNPHTLDAPGGKGPQDSVEANTRTEDPGKEGVRRERSHTASVMDTDMSS